MTEQQFIIVHSIAEVTSKDVGDIQPEVPIENLGIDSLDSIELAMELEEHFDITINENELARLLYRRKTTVQDLFDYFEEKVPKHAA